MRREARYESALALFAIMLSGQALAAATDNAAAETPAAPQAAEEDDGKHWWTPADLDLLQGLGIDAEAGFFGLGRWRNVIDLRALGNMQNTRAQGFPDTEFYSYLTDQGLTVRNDGWFVLDPRLLSGSASIRFGLQQSRQDAGDQGTSQHGDVTDYYLNLSLLQEKPYNGTLQASHSEYVTSQAGGGTTSSSSSLRGATLNWREASILRDKEIAPYFSAKLFAGQEDLQETTTNAGAQFRRDEERKRFEFEAHNGFETGDLNLSLKQVDVDNREMPQGSYRSESANVSYSLDFGRNLNWHSDTDVFYNDRKGEFGDTTLDLNQRLFTEINSFLSSSLGYTLQDVDSELGSSKSQRADSSISYMPFLNVSTSVGAFAGNVTYDTGVVDTRGGSGGVSYNHRLPWGGALTASLYGSLGYTDSKLSSSIVPVVNAPYQAPPQLGAGASILLRDTDILTDTIIVVNVRDGARLPTTVGVDYEVEVDGNRTRVVPLASSLVIRGGDPLEISYSFLTDPDLESRIRTQSYTVSGDWSWIVVSFTHDINEQEPLSRQQETLLSDQKRSALRVDLRRDWGYWRALGNARASRYRDENLNYDEVRLNESLSWQPYYNWQVSFDASQTQSKFLDSGRVSRYYDTRLGGSWHSRKGWWTDGYLTWRTERDSETDNETITEGFIRVRRNWPQLVVSASLGVGQRDRGPVQTFYQNLQIYITRTF